MTSNRVMPCFSSRYTACESRSRNIDASTLPVVICCAARGLDVHRRALQHALERERLIGPGLLAFGQLLDLLVEEALEIAAQLLDIAAALGDDVGAARIVEDRQQQVLERQVLVAPAADVVDGALQGGLQLG